MVAGSDPAPIHFYDLTGQVIRCFYEFHDEICDFLRFSHAAGGNLVSEHLMLLIR